MNQNSTLIRKTGKTLNLMTKDPNHSNEDQDVALHQNYEKIINWKIKQIQNSNRKRAMSQINLDTYKFPNGVDSNRRNSELDIEKTSPVHVKKNSELILQQNIANLAKINEETDSLSDQSGSMIDPSPKVKVELKDTWGMGTPRIDDTWLEIMNDIDDLELKYRLRENWLDTKASIDRPFTAELSAIFTINDFNKS